ncbi:hypothetical protein GCM10010464_47060 [Pseudonocardia yunnanensis]|uniref:Cell division protein FtsL n=1 Tax=Pseudonocardia yunnanensis TaxID=58107 RepID=A0ABW4F3R4_9PSEU
MSTPVGERTRTATRSATARGATRTRSTTIPAQRGAPVATPRTGEGVPSSVRGRRSPQAYAGREDRASRATANRPVRTAVAPRRPQFVLLVMVLLAVGLVATLWLSTAAAGGSYHLQSARAAALALSQQSERLHREVADLESAPELARRAEALGMVPVQDSARLVVAPDGSVTVVGQPRAAVAPPPPPPPPAPVQPAPPAGQQGTPAAPGAGDPAAANDSAASDDSQESATGARGDAAGTQGQSAGAQSDASTGGTQGGASTQGATGGTSTSGATGGTSTTGTSGDDSSTTGEGATTQGTGDDSSTAGTSGGRSTPGATGGATTQGTTGGTSTQGTGGADGTGNG